MTTTTTPTRRFTHVMIYGPDNKILALTKAEARSTMRFWREGERPDVSGMWTYNEVVRAYTAADRAATRADKMLRELLCKYSSNWLPVDYDREQRWIDRSEEAHARLEKWGPLLSALEDAERKETP